MAPMLGLHLFSLMLFEGLRRVNQVRYPAMTVRTNK